MKLTPLTETLAFFLMGSFISVMTVTAALGVDPFESSIPLAQPIAKVSK
jgi:hypothetical protein